MRRLQPIPTRQRHSDWWLVEGELRLHRAKGSRPFAVLGGSLEFRAADGEWMMLISKEKNRQEIYKRSTVGALWHHAEKVTGCPEEIEDLVLPAKILVRNVNFTNGGDAHDIFVTFENNKTVSILKGLADENDLKMYPTCRVLRALADQGRKIDWPEWLPNDEALPLEEHKDPEGLDLAIWEPIKEALIEIYCLEEDQIFYDLELARIQGGAEKAFWFPYELRDRLAPESLVDVFFECVPDDGTVGTIYEQLLKVLHDVGAHHPKEES